LSTFPGSVSSHSARTRRCVGTSSRGVSSSAVSSARVRAPANTIGPLSVWTSNGPSTRKSMAPPAVARSHDRLSRPTECHGGRVSGTPVTVRQAPGRLSATAIPAVTKPIRSTELTIQLVPITVRKARHIDRRAVALDAAERS
jgi:hypothetical protein